jgi:putative oxidoreductase
LQRLFSTFANGMPGAGLLLQRLIAGSVLVHCAMVHFSGSPNPGMTALQLVSMGAGILLIIGLWTPIMGVVIALAELWMFLAGAGDPWLLVVVATLGGSLALIGPGSWSIDARLFGRKQISVTQRQHF